MTCFINCNNRRKVLAEQRTARCQKMFRFIKSQPKLFQLVGETWDLPHNLEQTLYFFFPNLKRFEISRFSLHMAIRIKGSPILSQYIVWRVCQQSPSAVFFRLRLNRQEPDLHNPSIVPLNLYAKSRITHFWN